MDRVRELPEAERNQALQRLADLTGDFNDVVEASRDANADDEHDPEGATIAFERAQVAALVRQVQGHLVEVEATRAAWVWPNTRSRGSGSVATCGCSDSSKSRR